MSAPRPLSSLGDLYSWLSRGRSGPVTPRGSPSTSTSRPGRQQPPGAPLCGKSDQMSCHAVRPFRFQIVFFLSFCIAQTVLSFFLRLFLRFSRSFLFFCVPRTKCDRPIDDSCQRVRRQDGMRRYVSHSRGALDLSEISINKRRRTYFTSFFRISQK